MQGVKAGEKKTREKARLRKREVFLLISQRRGSVYITFSFKVLSSFNSPTGVLLGTFSNSCTIFMSSNSKDNRS